MRNEFLHMHVYIKHIYNKEISPYKKITLKRQHEHIIRNVQYILSGNYRAVLLIRTEYFDVYIMPVLTIVDNAPL